MNIKEKIKRNRKNKRHLKNVLEETRINSDPKENEAAKVPDDEEISQICIWISEVYPPECINNIISKLESLNWKSSGSMSNDDTIARKIKKFRDNDKRGWSNLGYINSSLNEVVLILNPNVCKLPEGINNIHLGYSQLVSSTSNIVFKFRITDEFQQIFNKPLNKDYVTYFEKLTRGVRHITPTMQRNKEINLVRDKVINDCKLWIKSHLSGYYCKNELFDKMPTCELITLKKKKPFSNDKFKITADYMQILQLNSIRDTWQFKEYDGLYFKYNEPQRKFNSNMQIIGKLPDIYTKYIKGEEPKRISTKKAINDELRFLYQTIDRFTLFYLFYTFKWQLSQIRDDISILNTANVLKANNQLRKILSRFTSLERNLPIFVNEVRDICKDKRYFLQNSCTFEKVKKIEKDEEQKKEIELLNDIRKSLKTETEDVLINYNYIKQSISTISSSVNSSTTNAFSIVMVILSVAMIILSVSNIKEKEKETIKQPGVEIELYQFPIEQIDKQL